MTLRGDLERHTHKSYTLPNTSGGDPYHSLGFILQPEPSAYELPYGPENREAVPPGHLGLAITLRVETKISPSKKVETAFVLGVKVILEDS